MGGLRKECVRVVVEVLLKRGESGIILVLYAVSLQLQCTTQTKVTELM